MKRESGALLGAIMALVSVACGSSGGAAKKPETPDGTTLSAAPGPSGGRGDGLAAVETALTERNYAEAKRQAEALLVRTPNAPKALYYAGVAAEALGDAPGAEARYRQAIATSPSLAEATVNLAALLIDQKRAPEAVSLLKPVAAKAPDDLLVQRNFAAALSATGDHAAASTVYERLLRSVAKDAQAAVRLGLAEERSARHDREGALRALREGIDAAGGNREQLAALGRAMARYGAFADAITTIDRAIRLQSSADLLTYRGLFRRSANDLAGAKTDFELAYRADPTFAPAPLYLGEIAEEQQKPDEAKKAYEIAARVGGDGAVGRRATEKLRALAAKR